MVVYCTQEFITEFEKISKKKNYTDLEGLTLKYFLDNTFETVATGNRLYGPENIPFLKKRLPDAGGFRFYFLADFKDKNVYLNFVHPKKQPLGYDNISASKKKELHDNILINRNNIDTLFIISRCPKSGEINFNPAKKKD